MKRISHFPMFLFVLLSCANFLSCGATKQIDLKSIPPNTVIMANKKFYPETITILRGSRVTWRNDEDETHNVVANDKSWDTGDMELGASKSVAFDKAGTYSYRCTHHSFIGLGMTGTVIVQ